MFSYISDIKVFIYSVILPITTVLMEVYILKQKPNPYFSANKDQKRYPLRCFDVILIFVITFLIHLLVRTVI